MRRSAWLAILVAGCSLAPRYERPAAPVAAQWPESAGAAASPAADLGWREVFGDARLQRLLELALAQNRDLRVAALNVELAAAQHRIARAPLYPTVGASAGVDVTGNGDGDVGARYTVGA